MPVIQGNYKKLMKYYNEIELWKQDDSCIYHALRRWGDDYKKMNKPMINKIRSEFNKLDKEYFEWKEVDGKAVFILDGKGADASPILKEGKVQSELDAKVEELYSTGCSIWV